MKRLFLVLSLLLAAAPAWAQSAPTSQPAPKKTLKQLKKERDITRDAYYDSKTVLELLRQERRGLLAKQKAANAKLIAAEKQRPIPTRQQAVRAAKQELHRIGQQLATNQIKLEPQQTALELLRLHYIKALAAYATRKLVVAHRSDASGRKAQAKRDTREAMEDLERRANLLKLVPPPPTPPKPPPFDQAFTPKKDLEWLKARMQEQVGRFEQQLKDLQPMESRQEALVKRLVRLSVRRAGRDLTEAIRRERQKLETLKVLRRTITNFKATYLKQIKRVSDTLRDRAK